MHLFVNILCKHSLISHHALATMADLVEKSIYADIHSLAVDELKHKWTHKQGQPSG